MIQLDRVTKRFPDGTVAVDELSLEVPTGQVLALLGTSGSGKTTTLRMINRLIEPTGGTITIDGRDVRALDVHQLRRGIGYVIQQAGLFPHRTIVDNVATVPRLLGWDRKRVRARAMELLDLVGLDAAMATRYPAQLSGGQQQRVGVARALAADPPVLLMDEPFGAVDPIVRAQLQDEFLRLQRELHKTVVFVTHDVDEAITVGTQVALLRTGGVLAQIGPPRDVLAEPVDAFVADFMGADRQVKLLGLLPASAIHARPLADLPGGWELVLDDAGRPEAWRRHGDRASTEVLTPVPPGADGRAVLEAALASASGAAVHVDDAGRPTGVSTLADLSRVSWERC
ncbi:MAG: ATP-binding cassette domain-containing protein [Ilumatobacteraceae bacterium]